MIKRSMFLAGSTLLLATAAAATDKPAKADANDPNKMVCKRQATIGSLVVSRKVCMTRAEWTAQREQAQAGAQRMQNTGFSERTE